jgi:hypothetical protein
MDIMMGLSVLVKKGLQACLPWCKGQGAGNDAARLCRIFAQAPDLAPSRIESLAQRLISSKGRMLCTPD